LECIDQANGAYSAPWRQKQEKLKQFFDEKCGTEPYDEKDDFDRLINVAIIDTGCDLSHKVFERFRIGHFSKVNGAPGYEYQRSGIWGCKDFVDGGEELEDMKDTSPNNHGTFMTHLLLDTMPYLKVFVARVFEGSETTDPKTNTRVINVCSRSFLGYDGIKKANIDLQAINHAAKIWGVDIISMSFHLYGEPPDVRKTIITASERGVLFFAAAGNSLHAEDNSLAFPATLDNVICINAHDDSSRRTKFTPLERTHRPTWWY